VTVRLIDSWIERRSIEFVRDVAVPLPVEVIARALNVPDERLADFKRWSDDSIAGIVDLWVVVVDRWERDDEDADGEMMRFLGERPERWQLVRDDPGRIERVVEETLRIATRRRACGGSSPATSRSAGST